MNGWNELERTGAIFLKRGAGSRPFFGGSDAGAKPWQAKTPHFHGQSSQFEPDWGGLRLDHTSPVLDHASPVLDQAGPVLDHCSPALDHDGLVLDKGSSATD